MACGSTSFWADDGFRPPFLLAWPTGCPLKSALTAGDRVTRDWPVALRVRAAQTATRKDGVWAARALTMASLAAQRPAKDAAGSGAPRQ